MDNLVGDCPEVSVVIPVSGDTWTLRQMLANIRQLSAAVEAVLVCPTGVRMAVQPEVEAWVRLLETAPFRSYDEARAVGARHARGKILLFTDETVLLSTQWMQKYLAALQDGAALAVTVLPTSEAAQKKLQGRQSAYRLLNHLLGHAELGEGTMSRVPYACTRSALSVLGWETLMTPPLAFAKAAWKKLPIAGVTAQPAIQRNLRARSSLVKRTRHILREHAQAMQWLIQAIGERGGLSDGERHRALLLVPGHLHLRSVYYQQPREDTGGKRGGKRKKKQTGYGKKR
ncbi:glycosyltransferase family 2 protein [Brevibacillus sp. GCM10020057]|uniref:glycosyltransferase family 2 protein n=1 Tax=Brevibacillus sp. GCM10020057 TaxID=3317327 RepID=UPI0036387F33